MVTLAEFNTKSVLDMSAEEIITEYSERESKRTDSESQNKEREFAVGTRDFPNGLMMALSQIRRSEKKDIATLTKCFSHAVVAWYGSIPEMQSALASYNIISDICADNGYTDLQADVDSVRYSFKFSEKVQTMTGTTTVKSITWVTDELAKYYKAIGTTVARMLCVGLCRCVCLNGRGWAEGTIENYLEPEVNNFLWYLRERAVMLRAYKEMVDIRVERDCGKQNGKLFLRKLGNGYNGRTGIL